MAALDKDAGRALPSGKPLRCYLVIRATDALLRAYRIPDPAKANAAVERYIGVQAPQLRQNDVRLKVIALPSRDSLTDDKERIRPPESQDSLVVTIAAAEKDKDVLYKLTSDPGDPTLLGFGLDAVVYAGLGWSPGPENGRVFWDRDAAERLVGAEALHQSGVPLTGAGVNVVLMDSGLDALERQQLGFVFGLSWQGSQHQIYSAETTPDIARYGHAWGIASQLKSFASGVTMHDYAVLPPRLSRASVPAMGVKVPAFVSDITAAFLDIKGIIQSRRAMGDRSPWVIVNAWSVFERSWPIGWDLDRPDALLNRIISEIVDLGVDVIFAAGNCGQFCPDLRCGNNDKGPGQSIVGPNGHKKVLTVGAVRDDDIWLGYSSQGPGIMGTSQEARMKPDLCAPSEFRERDDAARLNTGTSSACGVAAAAVAALRQVWPHSPPGALKQVLIDTARQADGAGWSARLGHGVLDLKAAMKVIQEKRKQTSA